MKRIVKTLFCYGLSLCLFLSLPLTVSAEPQVAAPSYLLMEASTGQVICEKDADKVLSPASITKIMTLLLIFDYLDSGRIHPEDQISTSAHAKSMGGSQVFLEEGEVQTLDTLIKCIAVASGNDACVAVAEYVAGSEEEFVKLMNQRAEGLGMKNTHFVDCCGLSDSDDHHTTARDVAIMSRELIIKHPEVFDYTKIWMEDITHTTNRGSSTFTLSSTNKLLKQYEWTTGLKTGSTSKAKYCLSATAAKDNIELIAVVMASPDNRSRFNDAVTLLNYGYSVSALYEDSNADPLAPEKVEGGVEEQVNLAYAGPFRYLDTQGSNLSTVEKEISLPAVIEAPVKEGQAVGEAVYKLNGQRIGSVSILAASSVEKAKYKDYFLKALRAYLL